MDALVVHIREHMAQRLAREFKPLTFQTTIWGPGYMSTRSTTGTTSLARASHGITSRHRQACRDRTVYKGGYGMQRWKLDRRGEHVVICFHLDGGDLLVRANDPESAEYLNNSPPV